MQKGRCPRLQSKTRMIQTRERLKRPATRRLAQIQSEQRSQNRRSSRQRRPSISLRQHASPLKLLLPGLLRCNVSGVAREKPLAVLQRLLGESVRVARGFQHAVGRDLVPGEAAEAVWGVRGVEFGGCGDEGVEVEGFGELGEDGVEHVVFVCFEGEELLFAGDDDLG